MTRSLQELAQQTGDVLKKRGLTLVTAESCTGGGLAYWLTTVAGSSAWFERGFVTYSDASKTEILGVNPLVIESAGAVSQQTACEMAEGALRKSAADISIAITGIAGPTGGTAAKPVGTVWIAFASATFATQAEVVYYTGTRDAIREQVIHSVLAKLIAWLNSH